MSSLMAFSVFRATGRLLQSASGPRKRSLPSSVPSLKEFVHKAQVLKLYRDFLRAIRLIEGTKDRNHAYETVNAEFRRHATHTSGLATQMAVTEGGRKLKEVQSMVGYRAKAEEDDSWLYTTDPSDVRGRVGEDWPWSRRGDDSPVL